MLFGDASSWLSKVVVLKFQEKAADADVGVADVTLGDIAADHGRGSVARLL